MNRTILIIIGLVCTIVIAVGCSLKMTKGDVLASLAKTRPPSASLYDKELNGGFYDDDAKRCTDFSHAWYYLNEDERLYVTYKTGTLPVPLDSDILSFEKISLTDLKKEIGTDIFPYVKLVHQSPEIYGQEFDPVRLIRTVNELRPLGKKQALEVLRCYHKIANASLRQRFVYSLDEQRIFLILRLLFVRQDKTPQMPTLRIGMPDFYPKENDTNWPLFPLTLENDIPFLLINGYTLGGHPESPIKHIEYCEEYCDIRDKPLQPADNPLVVVDSLINSSQRFKSLVFSENKENFKFYSVFDRPMVRAQALRAIKSVCPITEEYQTYRMTRSKELWDKQLEDFSKLNVIWDPVINNYRIK